MVKPEVPTPKFSHLSKDERFKNVYEPAEDTFLLLDSFEKDFDTLKSLEPNLCLEVGAGSGIVITFLAQLLANVTPTEKIFMATDINPIAVEATKKTSEENGVSIEVYNCDFIDSIKDNVSNKVDVLIFNPPYVVTPSEEVGSNSIEAAWAGGVDGREVIDRFLPLVPTILSDKGIFYLVVIEENIKSGQPDDITKAIPGYTASTIEKRKTGPERLRVLRYAKQ
eukprot:m.40969 g.40969  ORF g.40969 m.40969 type:complete len:224 (+) comp9726_c0_seq2:135-806(+)